VISVEVITTLKPLLEFLGSLLGDAVKDRLKGEPPVARGRRLAFELFQQLGYVEAASNEYVTALGALVAVMSGSPTLEEQENAKTTLTDAMQGVGESLRALAWKVEDLNPQLEIHVPDVVKSLRRFVFDRSQPSPQSARIRWDDLDSLAQRPLAELEAILEKAKTNQQQMAFAVEEFRKFLSEEYPFRESF
jgi:hypothetical protein